MNLTVTVMEIVTPVFVLAFIGYLWARSGKEYPLEFITKLTMGLSVPCLVFTALMQADIQPDALTALLAASTLSYVALAIALWVGLRLAGLDIRTYLAPLIFGNTGNLGLPLAFFAFGDAGLGAAIVVFAVMIIGSFTYGIWLVSGGGSLLQILKEPLVGATLLGGLFLWQGWQTPEVVTNTLELIGQIAIPVMLITLGVAVAGLNGSGLLRASFWSFVKLALSILFSLGIGIYFDLDHIALSVLVLQISTPVAVTSFFLAEKYGADSASVAGLVVISTVMSVAALPLLLAGLL